MSRSLLCIVLFLFLPAASLAGSVEELERVQGAFTEFEVERDDFGIVAVHFRVGERWVVADGDTSISGGDPVAPAVLLTLEAFIELAENRDLSGIAEGVPGEEVLFAETILIDPFDPPGDVIEVAGPFRDFELEFREERLVTVFFSVIHEGPPGPSILYQVAASHDTHILLERGDRGPVVLTLGQFAELAEGNELAGVVKGLLDDGVLWALRIRLEPIADPDPEPVVLEGPFSEFHGRIGENGLEAVTFEVDGEQVVATDDTEIVVAAPALAVDAGTQLSLAEFLRLGLKAELAGRVEGRAGENAVLARHVLIRRIDRPDEKIEAEGLLRSCDLEGEFPVLRVNLARSDRVLNVVIGPETRLFFHDGDEEPIPVQDVVRLCEGELVVQVHARGVIVPTEANDAVHMLASEVLFEFVESSVRGRFQGGEVSSNIIAILIGNIKVLVDEETSIEFNGNELSLAGLAELVDSGDVFFAKAAGALRKDGGIHAFRMAIESIDPPILDVAGRLVECSESAGELVEVAIQRGDLLIQAFVSPDTLLAERHRNGIEVLTLGEFVEKCNARQVYRIFGVGPEASPFILARAVIGLVHARHRGVFSGGEVGDEEILIEMSRRLVRVNPETTILGPDREPLSWEEFAALVEEGERRWALARGVLLKDDSIQARLLRLRARPNIKVNTPVDNESKVTGSGTPGINVEVFDSAGELLSSGAVDITGSLDLDTSRPLTLGEELVPVALGLAEESAPVSTRDIFVSGFE